jgi:hypothetical protein
MVVALTFRALALVCAVCRVQAEASSPCASSAPVLGPASARTARPPSDTLTVASLNIAGQAQIGDVLFEWARDRLIDILLLQEVATARSTVKRLWRRSASVSVSTSSTRRPRSSVTLGRGAWRD